MVFLYILGGVLGWLVGAGLTTRLCTWLEGEYAEENAIVSFLMWPLILLFFAAWGGVELTKVLSGERGRIKALEAAHKERIYDRIIAGEDINLDDFKR